MVDTDTYRARIGRFHPRTRGLLDLDTLRVLGAVTFIGLLLFAAGVEINPGPYEVDDLAMALLPEKWIISGYSAAKSTGDGNCLYNSCSLALSGNEQLARGLRHAVANELQTYPERYGTDHALIMRIIKQMNLGPDDIGVLYQIVISNESDSALTNDNIVKCIQTEGLKTVEDKRWSSILHVMALSTVIGWEIQSVYPDIPWTYRDIFNSSILPAGTPTFNCPENVTPNGKVTIFWTRDGNLSQTDHMFVPNHIVPLFKNESEIEFVEPPIKKQKRQCKIDSFWAKKQTLASNTSVSGQDAADTSNSCASDTIASLCQESEVYSDTNPVNMINSTENVSFTPGICPDVGTLVARRKNLTNAEKFNILTYNISPVSKSKERGRNYNANWESMFNWLRFSVSDNGVYCAHCFLFTKTDAKHAEFISKPFKDWKNAIGDKRGVIPGHNKSQSHINATIESANFLKIFKGEVKCIKSALSMAYEETISENKHIMKSIIDVVAKLSSRGIPLRGRWSAEGKFEDSNFNFFLEWISAYDLKLFNHLKNGPKNAKYTSPKVQNEVIECIGDYVRNSIIRDVCKSSFFSVMADETTDVSKTEQMSVCIRYVVDMEVREDFIGFVELERTNAKTITEKLIENLKLWNVDLQKWRGKGFDGASTMSGAVSGVQARITEQYPKAKYFTHCNSHCLNLVVVSSCYNVPQVRNFMNTFKELTFFFHNSAKRKTILKRHMARKDDISDLLADIPECDSQYEEDEQYEYFLFSKALNRQTLPTLSDTRWLSRIDSLCTLLVHYSNIYDALTDVMHESTGQSTADASSFLKSLESFEFIVVGCITQHILSFIRPLSLNLQDKKCDLLKAHNEATNILETLQLTRAQQDAFGKIFDRACNIAKAVEVNVEKPRTVGRQKHRANAGDHSNATVFDHFRINHWLPFLDHTISHMETRFPKQLGDVLNGTLLLPGNHKNLKEHIEGIKDTFLEDLPNESLFETEVLRWVNVNKGIQKRVQLIEGLEMCDKNFYPNIHTIFELILSLPVGSCSCERSFSALRRLKSWSRSSMGDSRLNGLALAYIHKNVSVNTDEIIKTWDSGKRRIKLS